MFISASTALGLVLVLAISDTELLGLNFRTVFADYILKKDNKLFDQSADNSGLAVAALAENEVITVCSRGTDTYGLDQFNTQEWRDIFYKEKNLRDAISYYHMEYLVAPRNEKCEQRFPKCIVIGVAKCGTREVIDFMRLHPHIEIYHRLTYEMPYFKGCFHEGDAWFKRQMPCSYSNQITIMKNSGYFRYKTVAKRIKEFNPNIKLILLIREPVSRVVSQFMFNKEKRWFDNVATLEDVVLKGNKVNESNKLISDSVYAMAMKEWLNYFNIDQFLFIEHEELKKKPYDVMSKIEQFLGLEKYIKPYMFVLNKESGFYCIRSDLTATGMACYAPDRGRKHVTVASSTLTKLKTYFQAKNELFFRLIGKTYDW